MAHSAKHHQCAHSQPPAPMRFCPAMAAAIGVSEAIVIHRLDYWLGRSKHRFEGRAWVYNTYEAWQAQFPFWSRRTIQATFRRLERLGVVESTQAHNRSRWDKTKWYTIDHDRLAELMPQTAAAAGPADDEPAAEASTVYDAATEGAADAVIDGAEAAPSWIAKRSPKRSSIESPKRGCAREPDGGARAHPLETGDPEVTSCHLGVKQAAAAAAGTAMPATATGWDDVDVAFELIPQTERLSWLERSRQMLRDQGTPWLETCVPVVRSLAFRLWGLEISV